MITLYQKECVVRNQKGTQNQKTSRIKAQHKAIRIQMNLSEQDYLGVNQGGGQRLEFKIYMLFHMGQSTI